MYIAKNFQCFEGNVVNSLPSGQPNTMIMLKVISHVHYVWVKEWRFFSLPSRSFLLCFMVVAALSKSSWVLLQFDNLFLNHQQRLIYPVLVGGCYWLFLCHTELISFCSSVSLDVKRRRENPGSYCESHCCNMHVGDETSEMASHVILPQL